MLNGNTDVKSVLLGWACIPGCGRGVQQRPAAQ